MKHRFLNHENKKQLVLFFSGWGMDDQPTGHLACDGLDVLMFFDYTNPDCDIDIKQLCSRYQTVHLLAWSLGVWSAGQMLAGQGIEFQTAVAINGTLNPISESQGISPQIFDATIDSWSEATRIKFNRRMCGPRDNFKFFSDHSPQRSIEQQQAELVALKQRITQTDTVTTGLFDTAVIGLGDRIFPAGAQENFWQGQGVAIRKVDKPHYLFAEMSTWREVLDIAQA